MGKDIEKWDSWDFEYVKLIIWQNEKESFFFIGHPCKATGKTLYTHFNSATQSKWLHWVY